MAHLAHSRPNHQLHRSQKQPCQLCHLLYHTASLQHQSPDKHLCEPGCAQSNHQIHPLKQHQHHNQDGCGWMGGWVWVCMCVHATIKTAASGMQKMYTNAEESKVPPASCYFHSNSQRQDAVKVPGDCAAVMGPLCALLMVLCWASITSA